MRLRKNYNKLWALILPILTAFICIFLPFLITFGPKSKTIDSKLQSILKTLGANAEVPIIITFSDKVKLDAFKDPNISCRRSTIIRELKHKAMASQQSLLALLKSKGGKNITSLWIINGISATVCTSLITKLKNYPSIEMIRLDKVVDTNIKIDTSQDKSESTVYNKHTPTLWNIEKINATQLWVQGYRGQGIVVASMDSGVDVNHPDLIDKWRGGNNSWYDPYGQHSAPVDTLGHGTQTMGIIAGGNAEGIPIGVAPQIKWVAVKIINDKGQASIGNLYKGLQWLLDPDGDPNTNDSPNIVTNSWGHTGNPNQFIPEFLYDIQVFRAAEIAMVFSAGNNGPLSSTSQSPANFPQTIAVGAIRPDDSVLPTSSRGPSDWKAIYPDLVAPGFYIRTADISHEKVGPPRYTFCTGTSMAAPHVAGALALLLSSTPSASIEQLEKALKSSTKDLGVEGPDNDYGYGLIDVFKAYYVLRELCSYNYAINTIAVSVANSPEDLQLKQ
jgi:bacillopeptidase F